MPPTTFIADTIMSDLEKVTGPLGKNTRLVTLKAISVALATQGRRTPSDDISLYEIIHVVDCLLSEDKSWIASKILDLATCLSRRFDDDISGVVIADSIGFFRDAHSIPKHAVVLAMASGRWQQYMYALEVPSGISSEEVADAITAADFFTDLAQDACLSGVVFSVCLLSILSGNSNQETIDQVRSILSNTPMERRYSVDNLDYGSLDDILLRLAFGVIQDHLHSQPDPFFELASRSYLADMDADTQ